MIGSLHLRAGLRRKRSVCLPVTRVSSVTHFLQVLYSEQRLSGTRITQLENATNKA